MDDIETLSQAERAYRRLRGEILHGDLMPGERLRAADLQERFGLGLTPIREALMRLSSENLVEGETNRGARVSDASLDELADMMATRREIERLCLTASMARGDAASEADRDAAQRWEVQHRRFHHALVAACGSKWLMRFWNMLADHSERYRKVRLLHHREADAEVRDINAEHAAIMAAVLDRDAERATALMDRHLRATENSVARLLAPPAPREGGSTR